MLGTNERMVVENFRGSTECTLNYSKRTAKEGATATQQPYGIRDAHTCVGWKSTRTTRPRFLRKGFCVTFFDN